MGTVGPIQASMGHVPHPSPLTPDLSRWVPAGPASRFINTKGPQRPGGQTTKVSLLLWFLMLRPGHAQRDARAWPGWPS